MATGLHFDVDLAMRVNPYKFRGPARVPTRRLCERLVIRVTKGSRTREFLTGYSSGQTVGV